MQAHAKPLEDAAKALRGTTRDNALRYAKEAALAAQSAMLASNMPAARAHLQRAQRWEAYALAFADND